MSVLERNSRKKMLLGQDGNALILLLSINIVAFCILGFMQVLYKFNGNSDLEFATEVIPNFGIPTSGALFLTKPWTLVTYMFSGFSVWMLISSMLWLWCYGFILQELAGNKKLIPIYLYGGLAGGVFYLLAVNFIPTLQTGAMPASPLLGAGPAIMAVAIATTTFAPRYKIFPLINGGIPLWVLTLVFVLINVTTIGVSNAGHAIATVAAGVAGFLFVWQLRRGHDWSQWMVNLVSWTDNLFNPEKKYKSKPQKPTLYYNAQQKPFVKTPHVTQQRIDELLDKINQKGYAYLTDEEKEFLKKASREEL